MRRNSGLRTSGGTLIVLAGCLAVAGFIGARLAMASGPPTVYVTNANGNSVTGYPAGTFGNLLPAPAIGGSATGLLSPSAIAVDASGDTYVANFASGPGGTGSITVYTSASTGNVAPSHTIVGPSTQLAEPQGIALDKHLNIYVANLANTVTEYSAGSTGDAAPAAVITGPATNLAAPAGIAVDSNGLIYVANFIGGASSFGSVTVYAAGSSGNVPPMAMIGGSNTGLAAPQGVAVDAAGNIFVANLTGGALMNGSITVYASGSNGNVAPSATIAGTQSLTMLLSPQGVALDAADNVYVANTSGNVLEYPSGSSGSAIPLGSISGSNTQLNIPRGIALTPPTPTATSSNTPTATASPSNTPTATATATTTATASATSTTTTTATATGSATATPTRTASRTATVTATATLTATPTATPTMGPVGPLNFSPSSLNFTTQKVGTTSKAKLIRLTTPATNNGAVTITSLTTGTRQFEVVSNTCGTSIRVGRKCEVGVRFRPAVNGEQSGSLTINDNASNAPQQISLSGVGKDGPSKTPTPTPTATPVPGSLIINPPSGNFGNVTVGDDKSITFTLSNSAQSGPPITFASPVAFSVPLTSPQVFGFGKSASTCNPPQLPPQQSCKVTVQFIPAVPGFVPSTVTIFDNAANANQTIPLSGTGK